MIWNTPEVKHLNSELVRMEIQKNPKCTKAMVAKSTSLSVSTCNTIFNELLEQGEIRTVDQEETLVGRPAIRFEYYEDYHHVLAIIICVGKEETVEYVVGNALGKTIKTGKITNVEHIYDLIDECIKEDNRIDFISIGIPGVNDEGIIKECDIEALEGEPLEINLKEKYDIEVMIGNDTEVIAYGMYQSSFSKEGNLCTIMFPQEGDSYVGAGLVIDGKILSGMTNFAGEIRYIAKAFGITTDEMKLVRKNKRKMLEYVVKMTVVLIATINPEKIVIIGDGFNKDDNTEIRRECGMIVPQSNIPEFEIVNDCKKDYFTGLIRLALNRILFPISTSM